MDRDTTIVLLIGFLVVIGIKIGYLFMQLIFPKIAEKRVKEIEKNPKWLTPKLKKEYYGFDDIDIILAESSYPILPFFRVSKENRFELLIPNDTTTREIDTVAKFALAGKIKVKYNLLYLDKSVYWLSILCYMLDGGDICVSSKEDNNKYKV